MIRGLQLGLGLSLMRKGVLLVEQTGSWAASPDCYITGMGCFAAVLALDRHPTVPVALMLVLFGAVLAFTTGRADPSSAIAVPSAWPVTWALGDGISGAELSHVLLVAALPQLPLTTLNSIVSTCKLSRDLFPERRSQPTQTSLAFSVGLMNLVGCLFGAMPMCHGAGGLAAQYRFGARRGCSMVFLGGVKVILSLAAGAPLLLLLDVYPSSVLGVLLVFSGLELARAGGQSLASAPEPALTVGLITAAATLTLKTGAGCAAGLAASLFCGGWERALDAVRQLFNGSLFPRAPLLSAASPPSTPPVDALREMTPASETPDAATSRAPDC